MWERRRSGFRARNPRPHFTASPPHPSPSPHLCFLRRRARSSSSRSALAPIRRPLPVLAKCEAKAMSMGKLRRKATFQAASHPPPVRGAVFRSPSAASFRDPRQGHLLRPPLLLPHPQAFAAASPDWLRLGCPTFLWVLAKGVFVKGEGREVGGSPAFHHPGQMAISGDLRLAHSRGSIRCALEQKQSPFIRKGAPRRASIHKSP